MFFLGGINSVLPYIIYLSLIWVFLIVGFSGKVLQAKQLLSARVYHVQKQDLKQYDQKVILFYDYVVKKSKPAIQKGLSVNPGICFFPARIETEKVFHQLYFTVNQQDYTSFYLRGPPVSPFIS
jgi:hypothetical protein